MRLVELTLEGIYVLAFALHPGIFSFDIPSTILSDLISAVSNPRFTPCWENLRGKRDTTIFFLFCFVFFHPSHTIEMRTTTFLPSFIKTDIKPHYQVVFHLEHIFTSTCQLTPLPHLQSLPPSILSLCSRQLTWWQCSWNINALGEVVMFGELPWPWGCLSGWSKTPSSHSEGSHKGPCSSEGNCGHAPQSAHRARRSMQTSRDRKSKHKLGNSDILR